MAIYCYDDLAYLNAIISIIKEINTSRAGSISILLLFYFVKKEPKEGNIEERYKMCNIMLRLEVNLLYAYAMLAV